MNQVALVCFAVLVQIEAAAMSNAEEKVNAAETVGEGKKSETKVPRTRVAGWLLCCRVRQFDLPRTGLDFARLVHFAVISPFLAFAPKAAGNFAYYYPPRLTLQARTQ